MRRSDASKHVIGTISQSLCYPCVNSEKDVMCGLYKRGVKPSIYADLPQNTVVCKSYTEKEETDE